MTSPPAPRQRLVKLGIVALLCALPFLTALFYLERKVERIDTLPVDEYKSLQWAPDGHSLLLLHRPLTADAATEIWSGDPASADFTSLGRLAPQQNWRLTGQSVDESLVLAARSGDVEKLALLESGTPKFLEPGPDWSVLPSQGKGLFYSKVVDDVAFDQMVEVEDAPEVSTPSETTPSAEASPDAPTRNGVQIGRYNRGTGTPEVVLTIPFNGPKEQPKVLMVRESPDGRFLALVTQFGDTGGAGLWVYDSEAARLLWTRVITDSTVHGVDWSPQSVALALCDEKGVVVLDNVLNIESTRYEAEGLGPVTPLFAEENTLYLVGKASVHRLDRQAGKAEVIFDSHSKGLEVEDFVVDPAANRAAFFASPQGFLELMVFDLDSKDEAPTVTNLPGSLRREAQGTMTYQVGNALRTAWRFWKG